VLNAPVAAVERSRLASIGFGGSIHELLEVRLGDCSRRLVLKRTALAEVWTVYRTGDQVGREAALLREPALDGVWESFACPYRAYAVEEGAIGLLMEDLGPTLLPDLDQPIAEAQEDAILGALAGLHARYWQAPETRLPWLMSPTIRFAVIGPRAAAEEAGRPASARFAAFFSLMQSGWDAALRLLPPELAEVVSRPAESLAGECAGLPWTLLHGDAKIANFGLYPDGRVAAFDWEWIGAGPPTLELGWYLAVNSARLARPKESVIARYRELLEAALGSGIPEHQWRRLLAVGILCGAAMLLWPKALALEAGAPGAAAEWQWWVEQLRVSVKGD
jgi:hypothetical protein